MAQSLSHPNIVTFYQVLEDKDNFYVSQELLKGGDLLSQMINEKNFDEHKTRLIVKQVLLALNYLHRQNIAHRDIKLENVMLVDQDDHPYVKLVDFGFATSLDAETGLYNAMGSLLAPELVINTRYDHKVDIWAVGVTTYMMLTGQNPFSAQGDQKKEKELITSGNVHFPSSLTDEAVNFIQGALCLDVERRLTAKELLDHEWLRDTDEELGLDPEAICEDLDSFGRLDPFVKSVALLSSLFEPDHGTSIRTFNYIDTNGDGFLSRVEIKSSFHGFQHSHKTWLEYVDALDYDNDTKLGYLEFKTSFEYDLTHADLVFKLFDVHNLNSVGYREIASFYSGSLSNCQWLIDQIRDRNNYKELNHLQIKGLEAFADRIDSQPQYKDLKSKIQVLLRQTFGKDEDISIHEWLPLFDGIK